ncbi:energy transducer TonB [Algoriphagus formosus]|jgi:tetratricopeptide (TPR) repeat protein|uniref:energy transducer TonB n=1 Tax=Algoriphagus formosus TaxID=2007308 RepID=UPI003F6FB055
MANYPFLILSFWMLFALNCFPIKAQTFKEIIGENLKYPLEARKQNVEGIVAVSLKIDANGNLEFYEIVDSPSPILEKEVSRIFDIIMESWKSEFLEGKPFSNQYLALFEFIYNPNYQSIEDLKKIYKAKIQENNNDEALETLNMGVKMYPYSESLLADRAKLLMDLGYTEESQKDYLRARRLQRQLFFHIVVTGYTS